MDETNREHDRQREFDRIVHEYYRAVERGETPQRQEFIAQYPSFRAELGSFFSDVNHIAGPPPVVEASIRTASEANDSKTGILTPEELPKTSEFIRDYLLLKKLGEGGFGAVYLAVHTQLEKRVAIKVLKGDRGRDRKSIERFRREIKAVGRFEHDHIVRALDAGKIDGLYFLVMEYIDGYDLSQLLACCGPLSVADACELTRQAALGLHHAHQIGLIHRDVKPSNLMLTPEGQVKLLDLGLAQFTQRFHQTTALTVDGQAMGTLKYMAPEQFQDCRSVSANCDIYSLGVSLYEFLGGRFPASGLPTRIDCSDLKTCRKDLSDELIDLMSAMTEAESSHRIQGAEEVAELLGEWTSGHDLPTLFSSVRERKGNDANVLPASPSPRAVKDQPRRSPVEQGSRLKAWAAIASAAAAVLLLIFGSTWLLQSWLSGNKTPAPVVSSDASLRIELREEGDDDLTNSFTGVIVDERSGQIHNLQIGINRLAPGDYRLELADWESNVPETFTLAAGQDLTIYLKPPTPSFTSDFHVLFPKIPSRPGAWAVFHASLGPRGTPEDQWPSYDITLRSLQKEMQGETECQWLTVTVESLDDERYRETASILIDARLYEREQELRILKGFIEAEIQDQVEVLPTQLQNITVEWSEEHDPLEEMTDKLRVRLPEGRLSVLATLSVLFDYSHPAVPKQISSLRAKLGVAEREFVNSSYVSDSGRKISSLLIVSGKDAESGSEPEFGYTIERARDSDEVPFSLLRVDIVGPLSVKFARQKGGPEGVDLEVNLQALEQAVRQMNEIASPPPDDFTRALLPETEGEKCRYSAEVKLGPTARLTVEADVRSGELKDIDGRRHRWIEVWMPRGEQGAMLLIDEDAYRNQGRFVVKEGWYRLNDEAFDFANGDATVAEESLRWLEKPVARDSFKVHEVLALLFNADMPSVQERVKELRSEIPMKIGQAKAKRKPRPCTIEALGPAQDTFRGYEWVLVSDDTDAFPFTIQFSREIPFGFGLVELTLPGFEISTKLVESKSNASPLLGSEVDMREMAARTQSKLDEINVHAFSIDGKTMVRQFKGYLRAAVRLSSDPESKNGWKGFDWDSLSPSDRAWIFRTQGHDWDYLRMQGVRTTRALIHDWPTSGETIILLDEDGRRIDDVPNRLPSLLDREYEKEVREKISGI